ncbi:MAG: 50S ribosomal protein L4 [bacterium]
MKAKQLDFKALESALGVSLIANGKGTQALHDAVVALQANRRAGTHATLTKATVNLSGSKPWRQKGTGRARAGYASSPVWRGGGVVFGPQPRDYSKKVSKKTKHVALKKAMSELAKTGGICVVESLEVSSGKTKELAQWIQKTGLPKSLLIITKKVEPMLVRACRNLPKTEVFEAGQVNAENLLRHKQVAVVQDAFPILAQRLK